MNIKVQNHLSDISRALDLLTKNLADQQFPKSSIQKLLIATDEALSNIIQYNSDQGSSIDIFLELQSTTEGSVRLTLSDNGSPFNPIKHPKPIINADIDTKEPGGLGIFLMTQFMDDCQYQYSEGMNILTLIKHKST